MADTGAHSSKDLFQLLVQELTQMQQTERQQMQDFLGQQEQRIQEILQQQEQRVQERIQENNAAVRALEERVDGMEEKMGMLESQLPSCTDQEVVACAGEQKQLETRVKNLEASIQRALESVFPRVNALLVQLEMPSVRVGAPAPTSTGSHAASSMSVTSSPPPDLVITPPSTPSTFTCLFHDCLGRNLLAAARDGIEEEVKRLLDIGANPNFSSGHGWTPLMAAARHCHTNIVSLLLRSGADLHARNNVGNTALHNAVYEDNSGECVSLLIEAGSHVNSRGEYGAPLHCAVLNNRLEAVRVLLAAGASRTAVDAFGKTALQVAWSDEVRQLLSA